MANEHVGSTAHSAEHFGDTRDHWWNEDYLRFLSSRWDAGRLRTVLDVGCGVGHWSRLLARVLPREATFVGVDAEAEWVSRAGARARAAGLADRFTYAVGRAEQLDHASGTFDLTTCQTVLIHLADPRVALAEMVRVTKPGGLILVAEPTNVVGPVIQDALAAPGLSADAFASLMRFQLLCQRGKAALGEGSDLLGEQLPLLLAGAGLLDVEIRLNDRVLPIVPPYDDPGARALVEELADTASREIWMWSRAQTQRYFAAGGGEAPEFGELWITVLEERRRTLRAISERRYTAAGGGLMYIAWGRTPT